ncbi:MAG: twin-arginine translocase TatA/TatE family subunit [Candidatus Eisenbacteria sp.]|nr:twin-arginine translocase TatA/TatE family subunit [Candidatus Eisenbacteria bacterium]
MFGGGIGAQELLLIFLIILLLFGAKRLPEFGKSLGQGIRQFRGATKGIQDEINAAGEVEPAEPATMSKKEEEKKQE